MTLTNHRDNDVTPVPYQEGIPLQIQITNSYCDFLSAQQQITAVIHRMLSMTMSPVLDVVVQAPTGSPIRAVLKLYDRRFGKDLRNVFNQHRPHTAASEVLFQSFIRRGMMAPFLHELDEEEKGQILPSQPGQLFRDGSAENRVRYEAALWRECHKHFQSETGAYTRLRDLQGKSIPRMLAHVSLVLGDSDVPEDLQQAASCYFDVKGVLLEHIEGYNLGDLTSSSQAPSDPRHWPGIVQEAANAAHEINKRGVLMQDADPRNVVVDWRSQRPYIVDFAQCIFKDDLMALWYEWEWGCDGDWDPNVEYWERASRGGDPKAIGVAMRVRLEEKGVKLDSIKYPDYGKIISDIKHRKGAE